MKDVSLSALSFSFTGNPGTESLVSSLAPRGSVSVDNGSFEAFNRMLSRDDDKLKAAPRDDRRPAKQEKHHAGTADARKRDTQPDRKVAKEDDARTSAADNEDTQTDDSGDRQKLKPSEDPILTGLEAFLAVTVSPLHAYQQLVGGTEVQETEVQGALTQAQQSLQDILAKLAEMTQGQGTLSATDEGLAVIQGRLGDMREALKLIQSALANAAGGQLDIEQLKALNAKLAALANASGQQFADKLSEMSVFLSKLSTFQAAYASVSIVQLEQANDAAASGNLPALTAQADALLDKAKTAEVLGQVLDFKASAEVLTQQRTNAQANVSEALQSKASEDFTNNKLAVISAAISGANLAGQQGGSNADSGGQELPGSVSPTLNAAAAGAKTAGAPSFGKVLEQLQQTEQGTPAQQLTAHVKTAMRNGNTHIQIQLNPVELGSLEIRLDVKGAGKTMMHITAENPKTLEMLRSDVRVLEQMLTDVGLKPDSGSLSFNLRGGEQQQANTGGDQQGRQGSEYRGKTVDAVEEALNAAPLQAYTLVDADGLDIRI